jgi:CheY-like chemotaxis protein
LGLSALLGLMRSHGGDLRVASSPAGARFELLFPATTATVAAAPTPRGLVLLVDDDEAMQRSTRRMLEHLSFSVMVAGDGRGAVDIFRREHARLSWVLMDQSMPNQSGSSAAKVMAELAPVPIVLMTGYDREATLDTVVDTVRTVLAKPFGLKDLRALIDRLALGQA